MNKLTIQRKLLIIRLYFDGLSYAEITSKANVSAGTVANVVSELKVGQLPGIEDIADQVEALRELAVTLEQAQVTPVQAVVGLTVLSHLNELGVEPKEITQVVAVCHDLAGENGDAKAFMKAALTLEEIKKQTGLGVDELQNKVKGLQESVAQLEPLANKKEKKKKEIAELEAKKKELAHEASVLSRQQEDLKEDLAAKEQHKDQLAAQTADLEAKAHAADVQLAGSRQDLKTLAKIGLSAEALSVLTHELKGIANHHGIGPTILSKRLYDELIKLDKALGLETTIKARQGELLEVKNAISEAKKKEIVIKATNDKLLEEQSGLKAALEEVNRHITNNLEALDADAQEAVAHLKETLAAGMQQSLEQVSSLKKKALELGTEMGKLENLIASNDWLSILDGLVKGNDSGSPSQVRNIGLTVTKALSAWLKSKYKGDAHASVVEASLSNAAWEMERWVP